MSLDLVQGLPDNIREYQLFRLQQQPTVPTVPNQQQKKPLRAITIEVFSVLNTIPYPVSAKEFEEQYSMVYDGKKLNYTKYGFDNVEDLLTAMPEKICRVDNQSGPPKFYAKSSELSSDLQRQIRGQQSTQERKAVYDCKQLSAKSQRADTFGLGFLHPFTGSGDRGRMPFGQTYPNRPPGVGRIQSGTVGSFPSRKIPPGDGGPRSRSRCQLYVDFIREMGKITRDRRWYEMPISMLLKRYKDVYHLPFLGSAMSTIEAAEEMSGQEFREFWTVLKCGEESMVRVAASGTRSSRDSRNNCVYSRNDVLALRNLSYPSPDLRHVPDIVVNSNNLMIHRPPTKHISDFGLATVSKELDWKKYQKGNPTSSVFQGMFDFDDDQKLVTVQPASTASTSKSSFDWDTPVSCETFGKGTKEYPEPIAESIAAESFDCDIEINWKNFLVHSEIKWVNQFFNSKLLGVKNHVCCPISQVSKGMVLMFYVIDLNFTVNLKKALDLNVEIEKYFTWHENLRIDPVNIHPGVPCIVADGGFLRAVILEVVPGKLSDKIRYVGADIPIMREVDIDKIWKIPTQFEFKENEMFFFVAPIFGAGNDISVESQNRLDELPLVAVDPAFRIAEQQMVIFYKEKESEFPLVDWEVCGTRISSLLFDHCDPFSDDDDRSELSAAAAAGVGASFSTDAGFSCEVSSVCENIKSSPASGDNAGDSDKLDLIKMHWVRQLWRAGNLDGINLKKSSHMTALKFFKQLLDEEIQWNLLSPPDYEEFRGMLEEVSTRLHSMVEF